MSLTCLDFKLKSQIRRVELSKKVFWNSTCKSGKGSRYSGLRVDFDENVVGRVNVDLKQAGSVEGAVEQHEKALVQNIRPSC